MIEIPRQRENEWRVGCHLKQRPRSRWSAAQSWLRSGPVSAVCCSATQRHPPPLRARRPRWRQRPHCPPAKLLHPLRTVMSPVLPAVVFRTSTARRLPTPISSGGVLSTAHSGYFAARLETPTPVDRDGAERSSRINRLVRTCVKGPYTIRRQSPRNRSGITWRYCWPGTLVQQLSGTSRA